jgi:hypothetical protein
MTGRSHEPIPRLPQTASDRCLDWSYERLGESRRAAVAVRDCGFLWDHERTHLDEIVDRIDATVSLKRQRDEYQKSRKRRGALWESRAEVLTGCLGGRWQQQSNVGDDEGYRAEARRIQEGRPQWRRVWWDKFRREYGAYHTRTGQFIFASDPESLIEQMDLVERGARLDKWQDWYLLLAQRHRLPAGSLSQRIESRELPPMCDLTENAAAPPEEKGAGRCGLRACWRAWPVR